MDVDSDRRLEAFIMWIRIRMEKIGGLIKLLMRKFSEKLVKTGKY